MLAGLSFISRVTKFIAEKYDVLNKTEVDYHEFKDENDNTTGVTGNAGTTGVNNEEKKNPVSDTERDSGRLDVKDSTADIKSNMELISKSNN